MPRPATGQVVEKETKRGQTFALRFRAYGDRQYMTLGTSADGWTRERAAVELLNVLADVRRGIWQPPTPAPVAPAVADPTFHEFASDWLAAKVREIRPNTARNYRNDLTLHLLPFFAQHRLSQMTIAEVDRYRQSKVKAGTLNARTINGHLALLAQILEVAVDHGHLDRNPASGRRRRLKVTKPRPVHLDTAEQMIALLDAATALDAAGQAHDARGRRNGTGQTSGRRACLAVLLFAGLRAEEVGALLWRNVDLANGRLNVGRAKTDAGMREVDLLPVLRDELDAHKLTSARTGPDDAVFVTRTGKPRDRHNVRQRVVAPAVSKADELLVERDLNPLPAGVSPHKLRHSFASLLVALGNDPAYVMAQLGHTDPAFTLRVYTHQMRRGDDEKARLRALVEGQEWAPMGTSGAEVAAQSTSATAG